MATYCPNPSCQRKLKLSDWRQSCPACGVNTVFFNQAERLESEADEVELSAALAQKKYDRMKASVKGSKAAVTRFVLLFVPLLGALLPFGVAALVYLIRSQPVQNRTLTYMMALFGAPGELFAHNLRFVLLAAGLVLAVLAMLAGWVTSIMACGPKWFPRNVIISSAGLGGALLALAAYLKIAELPAAADITTLLGLVGLLLSFAALLVVNLRIRQAGGVPVDYKKCVIAGRPEEEVFAFLAKGGTVKEMRMQEE